MTLTYLELLDFTVEEYLFISPLSSLTEEDEFPFVSASS